MCITSIQYSRLRLYTAVHDLFTLNLSQYGVLPSVAEKNEKIKIKIKMKNGNENEINTDASAAGSAAASAAATVATTVKRW